MSERGSFVTEFIYCWECFGKMQDILCVKEESKFLCGHVLTVNNIPTHVIAGRIGGLYIGEEIDVFRYRIFTSENSPCHIVRIAIISDNGGVAFIQVNPDGSVSDLIEGGF